MSRDLERERDSIADLARILAEEVGGGILSEALDRLMVIVPGAVAGATFVAGTGGLELVSERGFPRPPPAPVSLSPNDAPNPKSRPAPPWLQALASAAEATARRRKPVAITEISGSDVLGPERAELAKLGHRTLLGVAVRHQREVLAVFIFVGKGPELLEPSTRSLIEVVANIVALGLERDRLVQQEQGYREHLMEAGQMASLGLLTASVAQELRGPVGALTVQLEEQKRLLQELREGAGNQPKKARLDLQELTDDMKAAATQISVTVGQLTAISRRDSVPDRLDMAEVAKEALVITRGELAQRGVMLSQDFAPGCSTTGRRDNLRQVVINLVMHAASVSQKNSAQLPRVTVRTRVEGNRVLLCIDDTGHGVPPQRIERMFQGFEAIDDERPGHALPLRIANDVVTAHHGHIEVVNLDEGGASVRVLLPRAVGAEVAQSGQETAPPTPRKSNPPKARRIVIVDDDDLFTRTMKRALRPHEVRTAATASEGELLLLDTTYDPHMVLCDLGLPGMSGDVLHARIKEKRADVAERFVFITGGACSKEEADYLRSSGCPTLLKPLEADDILDALSNSVPPISGVPEGVTTLRPEKPGDRPSDAPTVPPPRLGGGGRGGGGDDDESGSE